MDKRRSDLHLLMLIRLYPSCSWRFRLPRLTRQKGKVPPHMRGCEWTHAWMTGDHQHSLVIGPHKQISPWLKSPSSSHFHTYIYIYIYYSVLKSLVAILIMTSLKCLCLALHHQGLTGYYKLLSQVTSLSSSQSFLSIVLCCLKSSRCFLHVILQALTPFT